MSLIRWNPLDPFHDFDRTLSTMRSLMFDTLLPLNGDLIQDEDANLLAVDMTSDDKQVTVRTALPGFSEDEINVDVRNNVLTISAASKKQRENRGANWHVRELRYGKFARSVMLPEEVNVDKANASLENGILTVKLPKQKPNPIQQIAVKARNLLTGGGEK